MATSSPSRSRRQWYATDRIRLLWNLFTEPAAALTEPEQRRCARLLSSLLVFLIPLGMLSITTQLLASPDFTPSFTVIIVGVIVLAMAYTLSRTQHYEFGAVIASAIPSVISFANVIANPEDTIGFAFITLSVLLASMLLSVRIAAILALANVIGVLLLPIIVPELGSDLIGPLSFVLIASTLIVVGAYHRNLIEADRHAQLLETQHRLRQSDDRYRAVTELISDYAYSYLVRPDGTWDSEWLTKHSYTRLTGYAPEEINTTFDLYHPEDAEIAQQHVQQTLQGQPTQGEYRIVTKAGALRWLHIRRKPMWSEAEKRVSRYYGVAQDISERKQAETVLRLQRDLVLALSATSDLVEAMTQLLKIALQIDELDSGAAFAVNERSGELDLIAHQGFPPWFVENARHYGADSPQAHAVAAGQPIYGSYPDIAPPSEQLGIQAGLRALAILPVQHAGQSLAAVTLASRTHDEISTITRQLLEGTLAQVGSMLVRVKAEQELYASEAKNRALLAAIPDGIFITSQTGVVLEHIPAPGFRTLNEPEQLAGKNVMDILPPGTAQAIISTIQRVLQSGEAQTLEYQLPIEDGTRTFEARVASIAEDQALSIARDITERKQAEQQRVELAVQQDRIQFLENIISDLSHDIKTPLTSIGSFLYLLGKQADPDKQRQYLDKLETQVQRLNKLVDDILAMARLDQSTDVTIAPVSMAVLADNIYSRYHHLTEEKNLALTVDMHDDVPPILGNEAELRRALDNLIDNAINYTPAGGSITVRVYAQGKHIALEIRDTGIGIEEANLSRIFDRFYRADEARNSNQGGTGLGLAIVKRIVDLHSGEIEVESTPGKGSTFSIRLPITQDG